MLLCSSCAPSPHPFKRRDLNNPSQPEEPICLGDTRSCFYLLIVTPPLFLGTEAIAQCTFYCYSDMWTPTDQEMSAVEKILYYSDAQRDQAMPWGRVAGHTEELWGGSGRGTVARASLLLFIYLSICLFI